jgi:hypothetical protein
MKWRREQTGARKSIIPAFFIFALLLGGCGGKAKSPKEIERTAADKKKAEL